MYLVSWEPNWTQTHFRGDPHHDSFLPTQSGPYSQAGAGAFWQGSLAPKSHDPGPIFYILNSQAQQRPHPHTHLKLISDLGPWGIQDPEEQPPPLPPAPPAPGVISQLLSLCHLLPPKTPNMPLHCSRVGRQAAAGPLDRGTLTQAMHAALAGAWGGQAPWPTGVGVGGACWLKERGSCCQAAGPATPPGLHPRIYLGTQGPMFCFLQLIHDKFRDDLLKSPLKI